MSSKIMLGYLRFCRMSHGLSLTYQAYALPGKEFISITIGQDIQCDVKEIRQILDGDTVISYSHELLLFDSKSNESLRQCLALEDCRIHIVFINSFFWPASFGNINLPHIWSRPDAMA